MNAKQICLSRPNIGLKVVHALVVTISVIGVSATSAQDAQMQRQYVARHKPVQQPSVGCGDFNYGALAIGPLDYRITPDDVRELVERRHFTKNVAQLTKGETSPTPAGDINYTLKAFPNHPRALKAAAEWARRKGGVQTGLSFSIGCWFDRAIAFRPDDVQVRILWAFELIKMKERAAALEQTRAAEALSKDNPAAQYNVGLLYFDLGDYERAMANARLAYAGGFNLPGLRDKLTKAGQWKE